MLFGRVGEMRWSAYETFFQSRLYKNLKFTLFDISKECEGPSDSVSL